MTIITQTGANGVTGTLPGVTGTAGQSEADSIMGTDISSMVESLNAQITGGNGGFGANGAGGSKATDENGDFVPAGNGSNGGSGGSGGMAEFDLTNDSIGSAITPLAGEVGITIGTVGGNGEDAGDGGGGGDGFPADPSDGIPGADAGLAADAGIDGIGAGAASTITGLNADMAFGGTIQINATGGAGGTKTGSVNRAQGGSGLQGSNGGSAAAGGDGGAAVVTLANSTLTTGRSLAIHLSAQGGQGGDAANEAAGGSSQIVNNGFDGAAANGGDAGNATAILNNNVITIGTSSQSGIVTLDAEVRTYSASQGSLTPNFTAVEGSPGATAPGHITFTNNTVTLGAGSGLEKGAALVLELSDTVVATSHQGATTTDGAATDTLNAGAGGNLDFSGNSFDGGGGGELTIEVAGGGVTADLLDNTISIGGSVDNALIGFNTVILDDSETFIAGRDSETVEIGEADDTVVFTAESGNLEIAGDTTTLVSGGGRIDFAGFGPGLDAAAIAGDTSVVSGNTFIKIGAQTLEILGFTGNASSIENFTSLPALTQIVVTVAQMEGFETTHTLPAAGFTYIVTDTAANIEAATATQIRGFAANGASAIVSTDATVAFTVAQTLQIEGELTVTAPSGDGVIVSDTAANIEALTTAQIAALPAAGFTGITATGGSVALSIAQGVALAASGLPLTVPMGDMLTVADTYVALEALPPAEILALKAAGVTGLTATVGSPVFSVAQALALADPLPVTAPGGTVTISDTAANLETLTGGDITALAGIGFTGFTSKDASVVLTVAQADAIGNAGIVLTVPTHDTITVSDTAADIEALSKTQILQLHAAGVTSVAVTDGSVVLSITQAQGFEFPLPITVPMGDTVTIADTAANIEGLTAGDIGQLSQIGFTKITATDAPVVLTLADAEAFTAGGISLTAPMGDAVTVSDTAVQIQALTGANIAALQAAGVTGILSTDTSVTLSLTQAEALAGAGIAVTVPFGDTVRYLTTINMLQMLTTGQIADLVAAGVTVISPSDSGSPGFSVAQTLALETGGVRVVTAVAQDAAHIVDDATAIEALTPDQIKALPAAGFDSLYAYGETLNLTLDQVHALENANIGVPTDTVILSETAAAVEALTPDDITGFEQFGVGTIAADGPVVLTVAQALGLNGITLTVPLGDEVLIADSAANVAALSTDDIDNLSRIGATAIGVTAGSVTLTLDQVEALESTAITVAAPVGGQIILTDTAADIEALSQGDIANLGAIGVTQLQAADASIVLTAADIQAFQSANITLSAPKGDTVTMSDTAADIETLDMGGIAHLAATGVTAIMATDAPVALTVFQALDLEGSGIAISAPLHDSVTIVDTEAAVEDLSPMQLTGLSDFGITGIDVPSLTGANPVTLTTGITFTVDGAISSDQTVTFSGEGGVLALGDPADDAGTITGFGLFDTIDLTNVGFDPNGSINLQSGNSLGIIENSTGYNIQFDPTQSFLGESFVLSDDGNGGTDITLEQTAITTFLTISAGQTVAGLTLGASGEIDVLSGGSAFNITISSGGNELVESGSVVSGATVDDGGGVELDPGGTASGVVLNFLGQESVAAGATDSGTVIEGGSQAVFGSAVGTQIMGGTQGVESGGVVTTVTMDGVQDVERGGMAMDVTVGSGGFFLVLSGGSASGVTVLNGGEIELVAGSTVSGLTVSAGGIVEYAPVTELFKISAGQTESSLVVGAGGEIDVLSGGTLIGGTVSSGGSEVVASGGVISGATVDDGGTLTVKAGGTTVDVVLNDPGQETISAGGKASGTVIDGGEQDVYGSATGTEIVSGMQIVESGGKVTGITVSSGGFFEVLSGGSANGVTVLSGGVLELIGGGTVSGLTVSSGGEESIYTTVASGQTVTGAVVSSAGEQAVQRGGKAIGTTVEGGGLQQVQGSATGTVLSGASADQSVDSGGVADGTIIRAGGFEFVQSGGHTSGIVVSSGGALEITSGVGSGITVLSGGELVLFGATVTGVTLSNGAIETGDVIGPGVTLSNVTVGNGQSQTILSGGVAVDTAVLNGGLQTVSGKASGTVVSSGGIERVSLGGTASSTHVLTGGELVYAGGTAVGTVVSSGGLVVVATGAKASGITVGNGITLTISSGGTASAAAVGNGGKALVIAGGTTVNATISSGGIETVSSGAHASATHVLKGGELVYAGGTVTGSIVSGGGLLAVAAGVKASGIVVGNGVTLTISSGATASGAIVSSGGKALVESHGITVGAVVSSGGVEIVSSGGAASGTHVLKGGEIVYDGGTITMPVIASGGSEAVAAGVKVSGLTVGAGVTLFVSSGGTASATVLGGTEIVSAGGIVAGTTKFTAHGKLTVSATTGVALSISGFAGADTLDLAGFGFKAAEKLAFVENKAKTSGVLTVTDGALHASVTLFGQYVVAGFHLANGGAAGTDITYVQPPASLLELVARSV